MSSKDDVIAVTQALVNKGYNQPTIAKYLKLSLRTVARYVAKLNKTKPVSKDIVPQSAIKRFNKKIYVITSAQNNTPIFTPFLKSLLTYCKQRKAQLLVIPVPYKNVNAITQGQQYTWQWPAELNTYYVSHQVKLNRNLTLLGNVKINATAINPLSGLENLGGHTSCIFGHAQVQMRLVATPANELPRMLHTTGSVSLKNYSKSKDGEKAKFHHAHAAIVIEIENRNTFHVRQLIASPDGSFYDLDTYYNGDNVTKLDHVPALILGDTHDLFIDPKVEKATWLDKNSIVNTLKPSHVVHHDILDFFGQSHHQRNNFIYKHAIQKAGLYSVREEILRLAKRINTVYYREGMLNHVIASNHNDHLSRWLNETDFRTLSPDDACFYLGAMSRVLTQVKLNRNSEINIPSILQEVIKPFLKYSDQVIFHGRNESFAILDVELSAHGDVGINGSRGSANQFAKSGYRTVIGHSHVPCIEKGCYQVGTSSYRSRGYTSGFSSWLHTHCVIYPNGKRSLINIINGKWRL